MQKEQDDYGMMKWQLSHLANALTRAKRLEKKRKDFHEELYETIIYPSMRTDELFRPRTMSAATDVQAIRIIELKERYDKKVQQEYEKHFRWKDLLAWAGKRDSIILIRYFQKKKHIKPEIILRLLNRLEERIADEEFVLGVELDELAQEEFKNHRNDFIDKYRIAPVPVETVKQQYLINGQFVQMTPEEYASL